MYTEYWGLNKNPFDNVPDPEMYFDMHLSVDDAVSEVLFAIEEGDECLAVVVGPVGVGKTMCLRIVLDSLDHEKHRIAFVTNPDMTFTQLLREMIGQLEGKQCEETRKDRLFEIFNKLLFETSDKGKRVVIFIDEGNVIKPHNLESLRLLTNMQDDKQNLFTIILAGQPELGKRLEDPRRANLFQRIGVYCKIHGLDSFEMMRDYIEHRLERAGLSGRRIFTDNAYKRVWESSENGTPRIINKICKLCLKAAETNSMKEVTEEVVEGIAGRFMRTYRKQRDKQPAQPVENEEPSESIETEKPATVIEPATPAQPKAKKNKSKETSTLPPVQSLPIEHDDQAMETAAPASPKPVQPETEVKPSNKLPEQELPIEPPKKVVEQPAAAETTAIPRKILTRKEMEELASTLATERMESMQNVTDPFEQWEKIRDDIMEGLLKENPGK